jgi:hypothetical protein
MSDTAKLSSRAAKVIRSLMNLLAEGEANWKASPEDREAIREARTALHLAFFVERDDSGNIVYENSVRRSCRGISPYDPREESRPSKPLPEIKKSKKGSVPSQRSIDVARTLGKMIHRNDLKKKRRIIGR